MTVVVGILVLLLVAGVAAARGHCHDSRDSAYGVGPILAPKAAGQHKGR